MKRKNIILSLRNSKPSQVFLMELNDLQQEYTVNFIYDELEDKEVVNYIL